MTIYIIVLHYTNIEDTRACLQSLHKLRIPTSINLQILLLNNNPIEDLASLGGKSVTIMQQTKNRGFAKAVNIGIQHAMEDPDMGYVMLLNNDTIVPAELIERLSQTQGDIVGPVIKFKSLDGKWVYDYGGLVNWSTGRTSHVEKDHIGDDTIPAGLIDYISGCCMLISRSVLESIGAFDERFFFYFEDVDFCVRAVRAGFDITVCPDVSIEHKLSGSIGRWSWRAIRYNLWSNVLFITKHLGIMIPVGYIYLGLLTTKIIINKVLSR